MTLDRKRIILITFVCTISFMQRRRSAPNGCTDDNLQRKSVNTNKWRRENDVFNLAKQHQNTVMSAREKGVIRRAVNWTRTVRDQGATRPGSCLNSCAGKKTVFKNGLDCYCDHACFEKFFDCCPDYLRYCGRQIKMTRNHSTYSPSWTCAKIRKLAFGDEGCLLLGVLGVWLIHECSPKWPADETKFKCENTSHTAKISYPFQNYLPVVGNNNLTYRNKYCAICNEIRHFVSWDFRIYTFLTPPSAITGLDDQLKFILQNGGTIKSIGPKTHQLVRYCVVENNEGCENSSHDAYRACINGPVEVVSLGNGYIKNTDCGLCQGFDNVPAAWMKSAVCDPLQAGFSMVFYVNKRDSKGSNKVVDKKCPSGLVYDKSLEFCREGYVISALDLVSNQFFMALWLVRNTTTVFDEHEVRRNFPRIVGDAFALKSTQISDMRFDRQKFDQKIIVASFRVMLTPLESLQRDNQANGTTEKFLRIPNTMGNLTLLFGNSTWLLIKMITKQLACVGEKTFSLDEYTIDHENREIYQNKTGKRFLLKNYPILSQTAENVTVCPQLLFSDCAEGAYVSLSRHEYVILPDLSLYHNATNKTFAYGDYYLSDEDTNETEHFPWNSTVFACLPSTRHFQERRKKDSSKHDHAIWALTICGFSISLLSLTIFLITYALFPELRTIPGKNMMNLSVSLLLVQSFWLVRSAQEAETILCSMVAVLEHYFILVSFVAMSVISYHSCVVFSGFSIVSKLSKAEEKKVFLKYFIIVWIPAAVFIACCITLDKTETLIIDYNTLCWLGTRNSRIYLFLLPIGFSILFNVSAFIRTAKFLFEHKKETAKLQAKRKQNLSICIKLSTLTGFPWIFGFLGSAFEGVVAFEFIFVVLVCLQGFYIAVAFLCNSRVLKLYKKKRFEYFSKSKTTSLTVVSSNTNFKTTRV